MKKIFLDCGSNIGQAMTQFAKTHSIDHTWKVHMFEPNPKCYERLSQFESESTTLHKCAVSDNSEPQKLNIAYCCHEKDWVGGETNILASDNTWMDFFKGSKDHVFTSESSELAYPKVNPNLNKNIIQEKCLEVPCIRLVDFIQDNFKPEDFIVLKLDIEGCEFAVLDDMITTGVIDYISEIFIEFHERFMSPSEIRLEQEGVTHKSQWYIDRFIEKNIKYGVWH